MGEIAAAAKQGPGQGPATLALGNRLGGGSLLRPHPQLSRCNSLTGAMPAGCPASTCADELETTHFHCSLHIVHNSGRIQKDGTPSTRTALSTPRGDLGDFTQ